MKIKFIYKIDIRNKTAYNEIAEKQSQKDELSALKSQVNNLSNNVNELMETNRLLIEQLKQKQL